MPSFNIQWTTSSSESLCKARYAQFFALVQDGEMLYVGKAFRADLTQLIPQTIEALNLDHLSLKIVLGRIQDVGKGMINEEAVSALHAVLVFARKPSLNAAKDHSFVGNAELQLSNAGCELLPGKLRTENNLVFVGKPLTSIEANPITAC